MNGDYREMTRWVNTKRTTSPKMLVATDIPTTAADFFYHHGVYAGDTGTRWF
jgi:hypothetical protein